MTVSPFPTRLAPPRRSDWLVPVLLVLLSLVPSVFGAARLAEIASGARITPANARFMNTPLPVVVHVLAVVPFGLVGAFQFSASIRRRHRAWHRAAGRVLVALGMVAALSGLWMTLTYPWPAGDGVAVYVERLVFGTAMAVAIVLAVHAILRRDFVTHGEWMTRAYAIGLGAGTQVFTHLPWFLIFGQPREPERAVMMGAGWVINAAVAEWVIHRRRRRDTAR